MFPLVPPASRLGLTLSMCPWCVGTVSNERFFQGQLSSDPSPSSYLNNNKIYFKTGNLITRSECPG